MIIVAIAVAQVVIVCRSGAAIITLIFPQSPEVGTHQIPLSLALTHLSQPTGQVQFTRSVGWCVAIPLLSSGATDAANCDGEIVRGSDGSNIG